MAVRLSDIIEQFIKDLICDDTNGKIEIQRNELAIKFNCVPSQINYVLDTRFTSERGYYVESRRGGGGHISIRRVIINRPSSYLMHIINSIGELLTQRSAEIFISNFIDYDIVNIREALLLKSATSNKALSFVPFQQRDAARAVILKQMLLGLAV